MKREHPKRWYTPNTYKARVALENTRGRVFSVIEKFSIETDVDTYDAIRYCYIPQDCPRKEQIKRISEYYSLLFDEEYDINGTLCFEIGFYLERIPTWEFEN